MSRALGPPPASGYDPGVRRFLLRTLALGPIFATHDDPRVRRANFLGYTLCLAAGYLTAWALGLPYVLAWAFILPLVCLLHVVWIRRITRSATKT